MMRIVRLGRAWLFVGVMAVATCAPRETAMRGAPDPDAVIHPVHVATLRPFDATGQAFGMQRADKLKYFRADISVPPTHEVGQIEWPDETPDAATDFVVTQTDVLAGQAGLVRDLRRTGTGTQTLVFIHGYNNTMSDSMYRLAQIRADFDLTMPTVLFSWPSAGDPRDISMIVTACCIPVMRFCRCLMHWPPRRGKRCSCWRIPWARNW